MPRKISAKNSIVMFWHCSNCLPDRPEDKSPREWASLEVGFSKLGIQVWCKRCEMNVCHIDFEGQKHPANTGREARPD